jgi:hypothetical protein
MLAATQVTLHYDVEAWITAGMPRDTAPFRLEAPRDFRFELSAEAADELERLIDVWTTSLRGLTKGITRMRTTSLIRSCRPLGHSVVTDDYAAAG